MLCMQFIEVKTKTTDLTKFSAFRFRINTLKSFYNYSEKKTIKAAQTPMKDYVS